MELTNPLDSLGERVRFSFLSFHFFILLSQVIFSTGTAVSFNKLTLEERSKINGISTVQFVTESGRYVATVAFILIEKLVFSEGIRVVRGASPANLTHVLLSLGYFSSSRSPDFNPKYVELNDVLMFSADFILFRLFVIKVIDSNGYSAPVVGVTVQFVGENDDPPVLTIGSTNLHFLNLLINVTTLIITLMFSYSTSYTLRRRQPNAY